MNIEKIFRFASAGMSKILNNGALILATIILSRVLNISTYQLGQASFIFLLVNFISSFGGFGLSESIAKYAEKYSQPHLVSASVFHNIKILSTLSILALILNFSTKFLNLGLTSEIILFSVVVFLSLYNFTVSTFLAIGQTNRYSIYQTTYVLTILVSLILFQGLIGISVYFLCLFSIAVAYFVTLALMLLDLNSQKKLETQDLQLPKEVVQSANKNLLFLLFFVLITQTDSFFIVGLLGDHGIYINGIYKTIAQLGKISATLGVLLSAPLLPMFAHWFTIKDFSSLKKAYLGANLAVFIFGFVGVGLTFLFHKPFIELIYNKPDITASSHILPILIGYFTLLGLHDIVSNFWIVVGQESILWKITALQFLAYAGIMFFVLRTGLTQFCIALLVLQSIVTIFWLVKFLIYSKNSLS